MKTRNAVKTSVKGNKALGNDVLLIKAPAFIIENEPREAAVDTNSKMNMPAIRCKKNSGP